MKNVLYEVQSERLCFYYNDNKEMVIIGEVFVNGKWKRRPIALLSESTFSVYNALQKMMKEATDEPK